MINVRLYDPFSQFDNVKDIWTSLLKKSPHSYCLSWPWVETWIQSLPLQSKLFLVVGFVNESPAVAFFIGIKNIVRHKFFRIQHISLNEALIPHIDFAIYVEYNTILIDPEVTISLESILDNMPINTWDEFHLTRYGPDYHPSLHFNETLTRKYIISTVNDDSFYVDLDKVRQKNNDYLALLSPNKRNQIRRSLKEYEKIGKIQIVFPERLEDALIIFDRLMRLHQKSWIERGHTGVFANEHLVNYHLKLISKCYDKKQIQLIEIKAGTNTIGYLYNFIYKDVVYQIQGGFNYLPENVFRPGYICHYFAILYNASKGLKRYDFLAGTTEYKKSLSTDLNLMLNITIQKKSLKIMLENKAVQMYRFFKRHTLN